MGCIACVSVSVFVDSLVRWKDRAFRDCGCIWYADSEDTDTLYIHCALAALSDVVLSLCFTGRRIVSMT